VVPPWTEVTPHPGNGIGVDALVLPGRGFLPIAGVTYGLINVGGDGVGGGTRLTSDTSHQLISNVTFTLLIMLLKEYGRGLYFFCCRLTSRTRTQFQQSAWSVERLQQ